MKGMLLLLVLLGSPRAEEFLPPDSVRAGMKGYGLTVFKGTKVDTFGVEALGVLKNWAPKMDLILVRLSGGPDDMLAKAGVIAGISGSPVFLGEPGREKLVGAVAYGWTFPKEPICGVTPISSMLEVPEAFQLPELRPGCGGTIPYSHPTLALRFLPLGRREDEGCPEGIRDGPDIRGGLGYLRALLPLAGLRPGGAARQGGRHRDGHRHSHMGQRRYCAGLRPSDVLLGEHGPPYDRGSYLRCISERIQVL